MLSDYSAKLTELFENVKRGDQYAFSELYKLILPELLKYARGSIKRNSMPSQFSDEDDVAISVFGELWLGANDNRFDSYKDRHALWALLAKMAHDKLISVYRYEHRDKRDKSKSVSIEQIRTQGISLPVDFPLEFQQLRESIIDSLPDQQLQSIVTMMMDGHSNTEIAEVIGLSVRSIQRKQPKIREFLKSIWGDF